MNGLINPRATLFFKWCLLKNCFNSLEDFLLAIKNKTTTLVSEEKNRS
jgi:hypothetical protein